MHYSYIWNNSAFNERMMSRLLSMQAFERVSDEEGFAAAGRALDMSPPAVTRLITQLESRLDDIDGIVGVRIVNSVGTVESHP